MTNLDELKTEQNLRDYAERNLQKGTGGFYHCPVCGMNHKKATLSIDGHLFKCFYGTCEAAGSVIDLIMYVEGKDKTEAIKRCRELYDRDYDPYRTPPKQAPSNERKQEGQKTMNETPAQEQVNIKRDFRNYFKRCRKRINDTDYPRRRGLDEETVTRNGQAPRQNITGNRRTRNWQRQGRNRCRRCSLPPG